MPGRRVPTRRQAAASGGNSPALGLLSVTTEGESSPSLIYSGVAGATAFSPEEVFLVTNVGAGSWSGAPSLDVSYDDTSGWLSVSQSAGADGVITYSFTIDTSILAASTQVATLTFTDALCSNSPQTATVTVVVEAETPQIAFTTGQFALSTLVGTATTALNTTIFNAGSGTMAAPTVGTIVYTGGFADWVTAANVTSNGDGTYALAMTVDPTGGSAGGPYRASIPIVSTGASNTPLALLVDLTLQPVSTGGAVISFDRSLDDASATVGGSNPSSQTVGISSANSVALAGPTIAGTTYSGDFTGWATPTIVGGSSLSVAIDISGISVPGGAYATVEVQDANAALTGTYQVYLRVDQGAAAPPSLGVSPSSLGPSVVAGGVPSPATITISNVNGSIAQLGTVSCSFVPGVSWASVAYSNGVATVTYSTASLAAGSYSTTLQVASTTATNSPRNVAVSLTVSAAPTPGTYPIPALATTPAGFTWDASLGYPTGSIFNTLPNCRDADDGAMPTFGGSVTAVANQSQWNAAIAQVASGVIGDGDVIEIAAGTVLNNVQLPVRSGWTYGDDGFVQIRSAGHGSLPAYSYANGPASYGNANRVDRTRDAAYFATFRAATNNQSTLLTQQGCGGYWLTGIDFFADTPLWSYYNVFITAHSGVNTTTQNQVGHCPSQIVLDRCSFRDTNGTLNKIRADGRHIAIRHCDIGNARSNAATSGTNFEAHGIFIVNTPGPVESLGNQYSASGIGYFVGGSDPAINQVVPSDCVNMWNKIWCPPFAYLDPDGDDYKNAIESKTGRRFIHAFNDIRYFPYHPQQSYTLITKAVDQQSGSSGTSGNNYAAHTTDWVFWANRIRNCGKGFFSAIDISDWVSTAAIGSERIECCYNLHVYDESIVNPTRAPIPAANKRGTSIYGSKGDGIPGLRFEHNTFSGSGPSGAQSMLNIDDPAAPLNNWSKLVYDNNVFHQKANFGPIFAGAKGMNSTALNAVFLAGKWQFRRNYIMSGGATWDSTLLGGNNNNGTLANQSVFVDPANWNYTLVSTATAASAAFPGGGGGTDGTDCGYNHAYLIAMLGDIGD